MKNNSVKAVLIFIFAVSVLFITANAATSDEIAKQYYLNRYGSCFPNLISPCTPESGEGKVNEATGALCTNVEDYRFEGKNDFDIAVVRSYNTLATADDVTELHLSTPSLHARHFYMDYICSKNNATVTVTFVNETELAEADPSFEGKMYYSNSASNTYKNLKQSGTGIYYTLSNPAAAPSIEYSDNYYRYENCVINTDRAFMISSGGMKISRPALICYEVTGDDDNDDIYLLFQDIQGFTHPIMLRYNLSSKKFTKCGYPDGATYSKYKAEFVNSDNLYQTSTHPRGFSYNMMLKSDDGYTYYVYRKNHYQYTLLFAEDRYGNGYLIDAEDGYTLTDDDGISYNISLSGVSRTCNGTTTELISYSEQNVNSSRDTYDKYDIDDEYIFTITKNSGTYHSIQANEKDVTKYYIKQAIRYESILRHGKLCGYKLPYKIEMPTGLTKNIEYTSEKQIVSDPYSMAVLYGLHYPVSRYYEEDKNGTIRNESLYTYNTYTDDYKKECYLTSSVRSDLSNGITNMTVNTTVNKYGKILTQTFKKNDYIYDTYAYSYLNGNTDSQVSSIVETNNDGSQLASVTKSYSYLNSFYPTRELYGTYDVNYTYHTDGNYIIATETYKQDENTTIKIENTLTADKKSIATTKIYRNNILYRSISYTYDSYGNIATEKVGTDRLTSYSYTYNPNGGYTLTTTVTNLKDADGKALNDIVTIKTFDADGNLVSDTDANGNVTLMTYDKSGRLLSTQYPDGTSDSYSYDISQGVTTYTAPNGTKYKAYFNAWGDIISTTVIINGTETRLDYYQYDSRGNITSYTRYPSVGKYVKAWYNYDYLNRPLKERIYDNGTLVRTTSYTYTLAADTNNFPLNTVTTTVSGDGGEYASHSETTNYLGYLKERKTFTDNSERITYYTTDYLGNVTNITDPAGNVTKIKYDALNNPVETTYPNGKSISVSYNGEGLKSSERDANYNWIYYDYDSAGRLISIDSPFDKYERGITKNYYDANGNIISTRVLASHADEEERYIITDYTYDIMNRVKDVALYPDSTSEIHTRYEYDDMGNAVKVVSGLPTKSADESSGQIITYEYDTLGRRTKTTTPDNKSTIAEYDLAGRIVKTTDKAGAITTYTYDAFDNLLSKVSGTESVVYTYNTLGMPLTMTDSSGVTQYTYNPFSELTQTNVNGNISTHTYDVLGRPVSCNNGVYAQTYTYDTVGRLTSTTASGRKVTYSYDGNSNLLSTSVNGKYLTQTGYNDANLPVVSRVSDSTGAVEKITNYTYSLDGNLSMVMGTDTNSMYYYDGADRLTHESTWGEDIDYSDTYTYDAFGNRTSRIHKDFLDDTSDNTTYVYNNINQLISLTDSTGTTEFTYDAVGNMLSAVRNGNVIRQYTYDPFNRLSTVNVNGNTASYTYNGNNLRQSKTVNGVTTWHIYNGSDIVADKTSGINTKYVRGNGLAFVQNGSTTMDYILTPRGDVAKLISSANADKDYSYNAYGEATGGNIHTLNPFGYSGEYQDLCSGLIYLRNRYYDPSIGRFITEDTHWNPNNMIYGDKNYKVGEIKIPNMSAIMQSSNLYAYCMNNPMNYVDPRGEAIETIVDVISIGLSVKDLINNPSWANLGFLAWDVGATILPAIPGSYTYKSAKLVKGVSELGKFTKSNFRKNLTKLVGDAPNWMKKAEAHHVLPQKFEKWFKKKGIDNIHDPRFGTWVDKTLHRQWSHEYNKKWQKFIDNNKNTTPEEIIDFASGLAKEYGFKINY